MALTLNDYAGIHVACGAGMFILTGIILGLVAKYSHGVHGFLMNRMLGVELVYEPPDDSSVYPTIKIDQIPVKMIHRSLDAFFLWFIGTATLTLALMVLYEGCILGNGGVYPGDDCPDNPMTCFAYSNNVSSSAVGSFECVPGNKTVFPAQTNAAWCYGWIVKRQTVSLVINQIGICGGILGVCGMLFAFMFRSAGGKIWQKVVWIILSVISVTAIPVMTTITAVYHISFSVLAYLVVIEVILLFVTVIFFRQKQNDENNTVSTVVPVQITPVSN